jgi:multicomponent K+:H+ antiporter subunit A
MSNARLLVLIVLLPFAGVMIPVLLARRGRTTIAWASGLVPLVTFGLLVHLGRRVFAGEVITASRPWIEFLGLEIAFRLDGLAMLFAGLILAIGLLVIVYARYYLGAEDPFGRFHAMLLGFMGAMLGIALSDNLLLTAIFWELTSLSSFLLIGYWSHRTDARTGARMALAVTGLGGLALLAGALVLGDIGGTFSISGLNVQGEAIRAHPRYPLALVLILLGAFTKSAQFPFHFWLPNAMAAPTPVSAYLHSATMVKAGLFLMARLYPALAGSDLWFWIVGGTGLATLVFGAWVALTRHDLKGLLAYSTISHLGLITLLLGLASPLAAVAAVFHIINHATFKASLFMAAGIIDHETGTRDMRRLGGLWQCMPITGVLAMVAAASMAGVPLLNGFLSKEMLFAETLALSGAGVAGHVVPLVVPLVATLAGVFGVAYSMRFIHDVFFNGPPKAFDRTPHEPPRWMRIPVEVLVVLCVAVGVAPAVFVGPLLHVASGAVLGGPVPPFSLSLWHGFNLPLAMSLVAMVAGLALYFQLQRGGRLHAMTPGGWSGHRVYDGLVRLVVRLGEWFTGRAMAGGLRRQVAVLLATSFVAGIAPFVIAGVPDRMFVFQTPMDAVAVAGWIVAAVATALVVAMHRQRFAAVILTGAVGLVVAGAFAHFSGPDLALTQIVVEVATVLLMLLALPHLPPVGALDSSALRRMRDAAFAVVGGIAMGGGAWWMMTRGGTTVSAEQAALSVPGGGGTNVVNVILVDFRGFDTYGEITVLAVAALGIVAMLAREPYGSPRPADAPLMLQLLARILLPFGLIVAVYLFLRGHNLPGGGFVAGLVTAATLVLIPLVAGRAFAERTIRIDFHRVTAAGLAIAGGTGLGAWAFGKPFLSSAHGHLDLAVLGDLHWASAALFDLGVFLVVVGVLMLVLQGLARVVPYDPATGPGPGTR